METIKVYGKEYPAKTSLNLTEGSLRVFIEHAYMADNWSGWPMVDITKEQRGNLTDLKRKKLVKTHESDGVEFIIFTEKGKELIRELNISFHYFDK